MNPIEYFKLEHFEPNHILHIGGHHGQEGDIYKKISKFTFVEPVPEFAEIIRSKGYHVIEKAIGEPGVREFNVNGQISGFLKNKKGSRYKQIKVETVPLRDIQHLANYDVLVVDTEGTVLEVLKSGDLSQFKAIVVELRDEPAFYGEEPKEYVVDFLWNKGFRFAASYERDNLFVKRDE